MLLAEVYPFEVSISVVGAIALAIAGLALFFKLLAMVSLKSGVQRIAIRGVIGEGKLNRVNMSNGESFENVEVLGAIDASHQKGAVPWELHGMLVLRH